MHFALDWIFLKSKCAFAHESLKRFKVVKIGGAMRDRTADLLRARQALSQLSYSPNKGSFYLIIFVLGWIFLVVKLAFASELTKRFKIVKNGGSGWI